MITSADNLFETLFDTSCLREDNYFCNLIGISDISSYNDNLALIHSKLSDSKYGIIFDGNIPKPNDHDLIDSIVTELKNMKIGHFVNEDINLTGSDIINKKIRMALDNVISIACTREKFSSPTIQNNFIAKLMIWCNIYIDELDFPGTHPPKCLYFGTIKKHEVYFLMILAQLGVDVVYFNPTGDTTLTSIDINNLCQTVNLGPTTQAIKPLMEYVEAGVVVEKVTTYARRATNELDQSLYQDSGIYRPLQFSDGTTSPIAMDSVIEDTITYWNETARMRPGFRTSEKVVYTPIFFSKINGTYRDQAAYFELIDNLRHAPKCLLYESTKLVVNAVASTKAPTQTRAIQYHNVGQTGSTSPSSSEALYNQQDLYSLSFCLDQNKKIKRDSIRSHILYKKMLTLRIDAQNFILTKLEEVFAPSNCALFSFPVTDKERCRLMAAIFTAEDKLLNLIEGYDFTADIPKIIIYLNSRDTFSTDDAMLIGLLRTMGLDILIFSPNGANNIELAISDRFINQIKLDEFIYDLPLKAPNKKGSFFSKLFR